MKPLVDRFDKLLIKAKEGNPASQYELAQCFMNGKLVEKSKEQAMYWAFKAVSSGKYTDAIYAQALGMEED